MPDVTDWVPWVLSGIALTAQLLLRKKNKTAFLFSAFGCFTSVPYSLVTGQEGFIPSNILFGFIALNNYRAWKKEEGEEENAHREGGDLARR